MRSDQYVAAVLDKCAGFQRSGLWPPEGEGRIRPRAWIHNFDEVDRPIAAVLLDHFTFFSAQAVHQLLISSFRVLRGTFATDHAGTRGLDGLPRAIFTSVEGESPNVTDSGNYFCRMLRQLIGIDEQQFLEPAQALSAVARGGSVVFVDDFLGSGEQFLKTWHRQHLSSSPKSFAEADAAGLVTPSYLTLVATSSGLERLRRTVPSVRIVKSHCVGSESGIKKLPRYRLQPDIPDLHAKIDDLLDRYAAKLNLPPYMTTGTYPKYGFANLGLTLAFDHSTPDSTLPIFWAPAGLAWTPLVRRS
jgi:hypothetical protein